MAALTATGDTKGNGKNRFPQVSMAKMTVEGRAGRKTENAPKPAVRLQTLTSCLGCIKDNKSSSNSEFPLVFSISLHNHKSQVRSRAGLTGEPPYLQVLRMFSGSPSSGGWLSWYPEAKGFNN